MNEDKVKYRIGITIDDDQKILASTASPQGFIPKQIIKAYDLEDLNTSGKDQTIIIIIFLVNKEIVQNSFVYFDKYFNIGRPNNLEIIDLGGAAGSEGTLEACLDTQWSHAMAPDAKIKMIIAKSNYDIDVLEAIKVAISFKKGIISMSIGTNEPLCIKQLNDVFKKTASSQISFASSGDVGTVVNSPSSSPYVVSVGGTSLIIKNDGTFLTETAWIYSGGGPSQCEPAPKYQKGFTARCTPDVSMVGNPATGVSVYLSMDDGDLKAGWYRVGGTSVGAPIWAGIAANINEIRAKLGIKPLNSNLFHKAIYSEKISNKFRKINDGFSVNDTNLNYKSIVYSAHGCYNFVTGLGSPQCALLLSLVEFDC